MHDVLNKQDVQELLGVSERTLENLVRARRFPPPVIIGKRATWLKAAVERWIEQRYAEQLAFVTGASAKPRACRSDAGVRSRQARIPD